MSTIDWAAVGDSVPDSCGSMPTDKSGSSFGKHFLKESSGVRAWRPTYDAKNDSLCVFRPFPCPAVVHPHFRKMTQDPKVMIPFRIGSGVDEKYGFWRSNVWMAWGIGQDRASFIIGSGSGFDEYNNVLSLVNRPVYSALMRSIGKWQPRPNDKPIPPKDKLEAWSRIIDSRTGILSKPVPVMLLQGVVAISGDKPTATQKYGIMGGPGDATCLIALKNQAATKFESQIEQVNQNFRGSPTDFENRFANGDVVSLTSGRWVATYRCGTDALKKVNQGATAPGVFMPAVGSFGSIGGGSKDVGHEVELTKEFKGVPASFSLLTPEFVSRQFKWWDDILVHTDEDALWEAMLQRFSGAADMLIYALQGIRDDLITDSLRASAANIVYSVQKAAEPAYGYPPVQPEQVQPYPAQGWAASIQPAAPQRPVAGQQLNLFSNYPAPEPAKPAAAADAANQGLVDPALAAQMAQMEAMFSGVAAQPPG